MTREEFNKLQKQEKIDLAIDRCKILWSTSDDNKTRNVTHQYARLNEEDEWVLVCTVSSLNDWFSETANKFFGTNYHAITIALDNNRKCFAKKITKDATVVISNEDIPDLFLETIMFDEIPNGEEKDEYLDYFDSFALLNTRTVYKMSKEIPMDLDDYIKLSQKLGRWATKKDVKKKGLFKNIKLC